MIALIAVAAGSVILTVGTSGQTGVQPGTKIGEWRAYTADIRGTRYSPLDQINASNFS
jgi:glucose dehydrogenase